MVLALALIPALAIATPPQTVHRNVVNMAPVESSSIARAVSESTSAAGAVAGGGEASAGASVGDVTVQGDSAPRQAPGVALMAPTSTMDCIRGFGLGGSNKQGSIVLGPTWKDSDCVAMQQFELLAGMGLRMADPAARTYCARPRFWRPFGSQQACYDMMFRNLSGG